jgi:hypothetical protein
LKLGYQWNTSAGPPDSVYSLSAAVQKNSALSGIFRIFCSSTSTEFLLIIAPEVRSVGIKDEKIGQRNRQSTMQIKSLVYLASAFIVAFGSTTQDVLNDIGTLSSRLTTLDGDLHSFSGGITGGLVSLTEYDERYVLKLGDC